MNTSYFSLKLDSLQNFDSLQKRVEETNNKPAAKTQTTLPTTYKGLHCIICKQGRAIRTIIILYYYTTPLAVGNGAIAPRSQH
eukprot:3794992-Pyramimonas_sp.AAC.1